MMFMKFVFAAFFLILFCSPVFSREHLSTPTARSVEFSLQAYATNENAAMEVISIAESSLDYFYRILGRAPESEVQCSFIWKNETLRPLANTYSCFLKIGKGFEIVGYGNLQDEKVRETLIRSCMIVFLQSLVFHKEKFQIGDVVSYPPLWLVEGLTQGMLGERHEKMESVVQRAARIKKTPVLKDIQQWKELSSGKIEKYWQQAFCYWLVNRAIQSSADQIKIRAWVQNKLSDEKYPDYWSEKDEAWWLQNQETPDRAIMWSWTKTNSLLQSILTGDHENEIVHKLTQLQWKAHFLLQPSIALYIQAFSSQGDEREKRLCDAREALGAAKKDAQDAARRLDEITANYSIMPQEVLLPSDDELLERYSYQPVDDIFKRRLDLFEAKTSAVPRN